MPLRDDYGSMAGRPGGFGGSLGNGGIGGGMGGGGMGGGAGRNGGIGAQMGMRTGAMMQGTSAYGRPGGMAMGYGMTPGMARANAMRVVPTGGIMGQLQARISPPAVQQPPAIMPPAVQPPASVYGMPTPQPSPYTITDDMLPGYGQPYTPPQQVNLPAPYRMPDVPPNMNNGVYGGYGHTAIAGGAGASGKFQDRVPGAPGMVGGISGRWR